MEAYSSREDQDFHLESSKNLRQTAENLWKCKIIQEAHCKHCRNRMENTWHALISCKAIKKVWKISSLASAFQDMISTNILGDLMMLQKNLCRADLELLVSTLWVIWYARNKFEFEGLKIDPNPLLAKVEAVNEAFSITKFPDMLYGENLQKKKPNVWTPLFQGWLKINVDLATDKERQCSGLRAVIRDSMRKCIAAAIKNSKFKGVFFYVEVEAEWGLCIAKEACLKAVILETDSQEVVYLINKRKDSSIEIFWLVKEIQAMIKDFKSFEAKYVSRSCSTCAHAIAKLALERSQKIGLMKVLLSFKEKNVRTPLS